MPKIYRLIMLLLFALLSNPISNAGELLPTPQIPYAPRHYTCYRPAKPITIDGKLDEADWRSADWTAEFVDIEGSLKPIPRFKTQAKMLWDSTYFYIAANMIEPDIWATLTQRDAVIYYDNDFEVFIDPDMDTHEYYELELNALNTVWDLLLIKPYRDGGPAVNAWDIRGLKTAVAITGTLNQPGDIDSCWSVEIAIPWTVLAECARRPSPPRDHDRWKINFSRVEWRTQIADGRYTKVIDPSTGKPLPENNWVWSPQGLIAMHYPEMWGIVEFSSVIVGSDSVPYIEDPIDAGRWVLRQIYYAERNFAAQNGNFTADFNKLDVKFSKVSGFLWPPLLETTSDQFRAELKGEDLHTILCIYQDSRITQETK